MTLKQERAWCALGSKKGKWPGRCGLEERGGNEVREAGKAGCRKGQGEGSASGCFFLELSGSESPSLKRER